MERDLHYIKETSNTQKKKVLLISLIVFIIAFGITITVTDLLISLVKVPIFGIQTETIMSEIKSFTPIGLFYTGFIGGLFFIPIPQEAFFYYSLVNGNPILLSFLMVNAGFLLSQCINYIIGLKLSTYFLHFISKRKLYKARRYINKHGKIGVTLFNFLPLPAPLLTFALGITKYNVYRLFFYMMFGTLLKYIVIILFFIIVN